MEEALAYNLRTFVLLQEQSVSCLDQLLTYFLLLLSELEVVFALDADGLMSSVSQVVCLLFPYRALGAELDRGMVPK